MRYSIFILIIAGFFVLSSGFNSEKRSRDTVLLRGNYSSINSKIDQRSSLGYRVVDMEVDGTYIYVVMER